MSPQQPHVRREEILTCERSLPAALALSAPICASAFSPKGTRSSASTTSSPAAWRTSSRCASNDRFTVLRHDISSPLEIDGPVDNVLHFASPASPVDYLQHPIPTLKVGSLGTHNTLGLAKLKSSRASCWRAPARSTATPRSIRSARTTGATSTRSACAAVTTRPSASPRRSRWRITATTASTRHIVRIFNTYGPRMRLDDGRVAAQLRWARPCAASR